MCHVASWQYVRHREGNKTKATSIIQQLVQFDKSLLDLEKVMGGLTKRKGCWSPNAALQMSDFLRAALSTRSRQSVGWGYGKKVYGSPLGQTRLCTATVYEITCGVKVCMYPGFSFGRTG